MNFWRRGRKKRGGSPRVLAATRNADVLRILHSLADEGAVHVVEAVSTVAVNSQLAGTHLVILQPDDVVPVGISAEGIKSVLQSSGVPLVSPQEFLRDPREWIQQARAFSGDVASLSPRVVAFTSLDSGGVGKTTLTLNLALDFQRRTGLPVAISELARAASGLLAVLASRMGVDVSTYPDVHHVSTRGASPAMWQNGRKGGITVLPMREQTGRLVSPEAYRPVLTDLASGHILTVVDAAQPHPLWPVVEDAADVIFVLATPQRPESMVNADLLLDRLPENKARLVLNMVNPVERMVVGQGAIVVNRDSAYTRYEGDMLSILRAIWPSFPAG